jgi:hypothetical protein
MLTEQALNHPWVSGRTVSINNYLVSPGVLGDRKNKEPMTPRMQAMHNKLLAQQGNNGGNSSYPLDVIKEENKNESKQNIQRKNSL